MKLWHIALVFQSGDILSGGTRLLALTKRTERTTGEQFFLLSDDVMAAVWCGDEDRAATSLWLWHIFTLSAGGAICPMEHWQKVMMIECSGVIWNKEKVLKQKTFLVHSSPTVFPQMHCSLSGIMFASCLGVTVDVIGPLGQVESHPSTAEDPWKQ